MTFEDLLQQVNDFTDGADRTLVLRHGDFEHIDFRDLELFDAVMVRRAKRGEFTIEFGMASQHITVTKRRPQAALPQTLAIEAPR